MLAVDLLQECLDQHQQQQQHDAKEGTASSSSFFLGDTSSDSFQYSLPRLKIALYCAALDACEVLSDRTRIVTLLVKEQDLAHRVIEWEKELLEFGSGECFDPKSILKELSSLFRNNNNNSNFAYAYHRTIQIMMQYPTMFEIQHACLQRLRGCLVNSRHKRAVVQAGGIAALVNCLERCTTAGWPSSSSSTSSSSSSTMARWAVTLLVRLPYTQESAEYYNRFGEPVGQVRCSNKDSCGGTLHLPVLCVLDECRAWNAIAAAAQTNAFGVDFYSNDGGGYCGCPGEGAYERQLAQQNIASICRGLSAQSLSQSQEERQQPQQRPMIRSSSGTVTTTSAATKQVLRRVSFLRTCLASMLEDPTIGEPLGFFLLQQN